MEGLPAGPQVNIHVAVMFAAWGIVYMQTRQRRGFYRKALRAWGI